MSPSHQSLHVLLCAGFLASCAVAPARDALQPSRGHVISGEEIRRSGARTAWQLLERGGGPLRTGIGGAGQLSASSYRTIHGTASSSEPLLVVDGARMLNLDVLRQIPAETVQSIEFLSGVHSHAYAGGANGVIVVRTAPPARR
ncbi:MAG TPA: TonB-dependent receptor plug domain-containing protein [Longimicrobiaceae bacterium]|nr:TonB-dependent receptor plug domain-containing protein [Longimicrobiaceae bacterium]